MREFLFFVASSFWAGAAHAATPGHGKTIAAAYIVGARGKPIDAVILGIFVTLSHVSGIVLVGVLASLGSTWLRPQRIEAYLAIAVGILVIVLGHGCCGCSAILWRSLWAKPASRATLQVERRMLTRGIMVTTMLTTITRIAMLMITGTTSPWSGTATDLAKSMLTGWTSWPKIVPSCRCCWRWVLQVACFRIPPRWRCCSAPYRAEKSCSA